MPFRKIAVHAEDLIARWTTVFFQQSIELASAYHIRLPTVGRSPSFNMVKRQKLYVRLATAGTVASTIGLKYFTLDPVSRVSVNNVVAIFIEESTRSIFSPALFAPPNAVHRWSFAAVIT